MHMERRSREQTVCGSGKASDSSNDENGTNAASSTRADQSSGWGLYALKSSWEAVREIHGPSKH